MGLINIFGKSKRCNKEQTVSDSMPDEENKAVYRKEDEGNSNPLLNILEENLHNNVTKNKTMEEKKQEQQKNANGESAKVYNLIILDESGSMSDIYQEALTGVNETLQTIRMAKEDHPEQEHYVTLVAFDTEHYNEIYKGTPAGKAIDITPEQYRPGGCTPLYDAMGRAISDLRNHLDYLAPSSNKEDSVVLVTVITDGYENASSEYTGPAIKALIEEMRKKDWVFTYIGANQDVEKVAESMSINNRMSFRSTSEGTQDMFAKERMARKKFFGKFSRISKGEMSREELDKDFFTDI